MNQRPNYIDPRSTKYFLQHSQRPPPRPMMPPNQPVSSGASLENLIRWGANLPPVTANVINQSNQMDKQGPRMMNMQRPPMMSEQNFHPSNLGPIGLLNLHPNQTPGLNQQLNRMSGMPPSTNILKPIANQPSAFHGQPRNAQNLRTSEKPQNAFTQPSTSMISSANDILDQRNQMNSSGSGSSSSAEHKSQKPSTNRPTTPGGFRSSDLRPKTPTRPNLPKNAVIKVPEVIDPHVMRQGHGRKAATPIRQKATTPVRQPKGTTPARQQPKATTLNRGAGRARTPIHNITHDSESGVSDMPKRRGRPPGSRNKATPARGLEEPSMGNLEDDLFIIDSASGRGGRMATPIRTRATTPKSNARATTPKSNATQTHARKATPTRSLAMTLSRDSQLIIEAQRQRTPARSNRLGNTTPARSNARNSGFDEPSTSRGNQNMSRKRTPARGESPVPTKRERNVTPPGAFVLNALDYEYYMRQKKKMRNAVLGMHGFVREMETAMQTIDDFVPIMRANNLFDKPKTPRHQ